MASKSALMRHQSVAAKWRPLFSEYRNSHGDQGPDGRQRIR
jgi:hypothetical protein